MKKSLILLGLTAILCLSFCAQSFSDSKSSFINDDELLLHSKKAQGVEEKIYWKKGLEGLLPSEVPFSFGKKVSVQSELMVMQKHFDIYSEHKDFIVPMQVAIDSEAVLQRPLQSNRRERWTSMSARWSSDFISAKSYVSTGADEHEQTQDVPLILGIEGESSIFDLGILGKVNYVSNMNSFEDTSRVNFHVKSEYSLGDRWNSNLQLGWDVFGESKSSYESSVTSRMSLQEAETIYNPNSDNLSVVNAKVKCYPFRNMKLSLNYFHYAQNKAQTAGYSPSDYLLADRSKSLWTSRITNGYEKQLGSEINFSAGIQTDSGIYSTLLAGWYSPGDAYEESPSDESVFEIRGEIVVSF